MKSKILKRLKGMNTAFCSYSSLSLFLPVSDIPFYGENEEIGQLHFALVKGSPKGTNERKKKWKKDRSRSKKRFIKFWTLVLGKWRARSGFVFVPDYVRFSSAPRIILSWKLNQMWQAPRSPAEVKSTKNNQDRLLLIEIITVIEVPIWSEIPYWSFLWAEIDFY